MVSTASLPVPTLQGDTATYRNVPPPPPPHNRPPSAPQNVTASPGDTTGTIGWSPPADAGNPALAGYVLYLWQMVNGAWEVVDGVVLPSGQTSWSRSGLINGRTHFASVYTYNGAGWGPYSMSPTFVPAVPPTAPANIVATAGPNGSATVRWSPSTTGGGASMIAYIVWAYNGNWISYWDANSNRTSDEAGTHSFNSADQLTDTGFAYDAGGNQTASPSFPAASYNGIEQTSSITASGQAPAAMSYAAMGQAEWTISPAGTAQNGAMGVQTETLGGQTSSYIRDGAGSLVYLKSSAGDFYYYFDGLGSVIGLIDATTGDQRADYSYDPFGSHATAVGVNGALPANPWRWMGGYLDGTGLYHFGERYYDRPWAGSYRRTQLPVAAAMRMTTPVGTQLICLTLRNGDSPKLFGKMGLPQSGLQVYP